MFGKNPIRKQELGDGNQLAIQEVFSTIQGEGPLAGSPAIFVRVWGCNLSCVFCDTDFETSTWKPTLKELLDKICAVNERGCDLVVITGGEPFRQNIIPLIKELTAVGYRVQIETAGTLWVPGIEDVFPKKKEVPDFNPQCTIVCSPKTGKLNEKLVPYIHYYKYIIRVGEICEEDGLPCASTQDPEKEMIIARPPAEWLKRDVYVQPCDDPNLNPQENLRAAVDVSMRFGFRLSIQQHKILSLP